MVGLHDGREQGPEYSQAQEQEPWWEFRLSTVMSRPIYVLALNCCMALLRIRPRSVYELYIIFDGLVWRIRQWAGDSDKRGQIGLVLLQSQVQSRPTYN